MSLIFALLYVVLVLRKKIKPNANKSVIIKRRLRRSFLGARTIIATFLVVIVVSLGVSSIFGIVLFAPSVKAEDKYAHEGATIANNIEVVVQLDEDIWATLSSQEKLNTLQTIANIEANYFGLPHELNVTIGHLSENTLACYNDAKHLITLNIDHFEHDPAYKVLDSLCHEARHAYQYRLCDLFDSTSEEQKELLLFYDVQYYKQEFSNYVDGKENIYEYYFQWCEADSRDYAREAVADYYSRIDEYLLNTGA